MRCGICNTTRAELQCPSCISFTLLKPKLSYLDTLEAIVTLRDEVDECLKHCINGANYKFVKAYTNGDVEGGLKRKGVVALSSQLLSIDTRILKTRDARIDKEVNVVRERNAQLRASVEELRGMVADRQQLKKTSSSQMDTITKLTEAKMFKQQDNNNLKKQIQNSKSLLFQELINLYMIKRRKISGSQLNVYMISLTPMVSAINLVDFNYELVNASLGLICKFISQVAKILLMVLPFHIEMIKETGAYEIHGLTLKLQKQIWQVDNLELRQFCNAVCMLTVDVFKVLESLELHNEIKTYADLLRLDTLVYKLANNGQMFESTKGKPLEGEVDLESLNATLYESILARIRHKDDEWHVVKREYLE